MGAYLQKLFGLHNRMRRKKNVEESFPSTLKLRKELENPETDPVRREHIVRLVMAPWSDPFWRPIDLSELVDRNSPNETLIFCCDIYSKLVQEFAPKHQFNHSNHVRFRDLLYWYSYERVLVRKVPKGHRVSLRLV